MELKYKLNCGSTNQNHNQNQNYYFKKIIIKKEGIATP